MTATVFAQIPLLSPYFPVLDDERLLTPLAVHRTIPFPMVKTCTITPCLSISKYSHFDKSVGETGDAVSEMSVIFSACEAIRGAYGREEVSRLSPTELSRNRPRNFHIYTQGETASRAKGVRSVREEPPKSSGGVHTAQSAHEGAPG